MSERLQSPPQWQKIDGPQQVVEHPRGPDHRRSDEETAHMADGSQYSITPDSGKTERLGYLTAEDVKRCRAIALRDADMVRQIVAEVAEATGTPSKAIMGVRRDKITSQARQLAMYVARRQGMPYEAIAYHFQRDHTTVIHAVRAEEKRRGDR